MFVIESLNDEHDSNVISMNSLNIQNANDDCTSHDKNVSYKHVNFCGVERLGAIFIHHMICVLLGASFYFILFCLLFE